MVISTHAVLETKQLLLRPNTNATWITTHQIKTYSTPYMYTLFATSTEHIDRYASTCAHSHTMRARTMRAYANARIRIACERISHASRKHSHTLFGVLRVRYARICAHSHEMRAHSHRMRSHSHRMRSHCMRMRAFKGNLCVSGTVWWIRMYRLGLFFFVVLSATYKHIYIYIWIGIISMVSIYI